MRYRTRSWLEWTRRLAAVVGASFALGALTTSALIWRQQRIEVRPAERPADVVPVWRAPADGKAVATRGVISETAAVAALRARNLMLPVEHVGPAGLRDSFFDPRGVRTHEALDIMAPRATPVRAVDDGTIAKLYFSQGGGGNTIYQFDPGRTFSYYYAHLDGYAPGLREGQPVRRGDLIGYVGSTGNASAAAPHLHFAIFRLAAGGRWWEGDPINPYAVFSR